MKYTAEMTRAIYADPRLDKPMLRRQARNLRTAAKIAALNWPGRSGSVVMPYNIQVDWQAPIKGDQRLHVISVRYAVEAEA